MKKSGWEWAKDIVCWMCAGGIVFYVAWMWGKLPELIAVRAGSTGVSYDDPSVIRTPCVLAVLAAIWLYLVEPFVYALPIKPLDEQKKGPILRCIVAALGSVRRWTTVLLCVLALDRLLFAQGIAPIGGWANPAGLLVCVATVAGRAWKASKLYRMPAPPREIEGDARSDEEDRAADAESGEASAEAPPEGAQEQRA